MKDRRLTILRKVSLTHGILPKSYHLPLSDTIPCSSGGFADVWRGQLDGRQMCVKAFRTHGMSNLDKIKRVCVMFRPEGGRNLIMISGSIMRSSGGSTLCIRTYYPSTEFRRCFRSVS